MDIFTIIYLILFFFGIWFLLIFLILHLRNYSKLNHSPTPSSYPTISFLVPAYNEEKTIRDTITSLLNLEYPQNKKQIIIINDGSKDKTKEIASLLARQNPSVILLDKPNSGKADSLNQAIKKATGEFIAVTDADSYPKKDALLKMIGHFEDKNVGAVTSRVLVKNKKNWLEKFQVLDYSIIAWTRKLFDFVDSVYVTNGPLSIYRKDVLLQIGGFDPKNLTEDIEVTWHILQQGYTTRMSYDAVVYTSVPSDLKTWIRQRVRWNLGGLQTVHKYWKTIFTRGIFGNFIVPYVALSFILAVIGIVLFIRFLWIKGAYQAFTLYYITRGYDYFRYLEFSLYFSVLLLMGGIFLILAIIYYKQGFKNSETGNKSILSILAYTMIYRPLYTIPLLLAIYKLLKGDIRWYTK